ncbi:MAG: hypothetical protein ACREFP_21075 [Acetobacteraceae bacterium]
MSSWFAVAATVTSGIVAFLGAKDQKDKFNVAWHLLKLAIESGAGEEALQGAILRGESIINSEALQKYAPDLYVASPTLSSEDRAV